MTENRFSRHPKKTIGLLLLAVFFLLDFGLGAIFCPKAVGTPDAYYHHDLPRNISGTKVWGDRTYPVFTNSLGFIDRQVRFVPLAAPGKRLLLLGDSFTEGVGHPFDETFAGILSRSLEGQGVEVLNAAVTSYSPKLYYLKARYLLEVAGLRFDDLLVAIDISDIQDEVVHDEFIPAGDFGISRSYLLNRIDSLLNRISLSYHGLRTLVGRSPGVSRGLLSADVDVEKVLANWDRDRDRWTDDQDVYRAWGAEGLRLAAEQMRQLAGLCREHQVRLTIVVYPWPRQVLAGDLDSLQSRFWREFCVQQDLGFIDLFPDFIQPGHAEQMLGRHFIPGDVHCNAAGHRLVAERLLRWWHESGDS